MADAGLEHQVNAFPMLAKSETLTKRHVDRTRKLDPGACVRCASQPLPNALAQALIIAELPPHVHLRSLALVIRVGRVCMCEWASGEYKAGSRECAHLTSAVACRRCDRSICSVSPGRIISFELPRLPSSHKRKIPDRRNL